MPDLCDGSEAETKVSDTVAKTSGEPKKSNPSLTSKELEWHNAKHGLFEEAEKIVVRIEVTDTGLGIAPQDLANANIFCKQILHRYAPIFKLPFSRLHPD